MCSARLNCQNHLVLCFLVKELLCGHRHPTVVPRLRSVYVKNGELSIVGNAGLSTRARQHGDLIIVFSKVEVSEPCGCVFGPRSSFCGPRHPTFAPRLHSVAVKRLRVRDCGQCRCLNSAASPVRHFSALAFSPWQFVCPWSLFVSGAL